MHRCSMCGEAVDVPREQERFFGFDNPVFCAIDCIRQFVCQQFPAPLGDPIWDKVELFPVDESMPDGLFYSPMLHMSFRSGYEVLVAETLVLRWKETVWYEPHVVHVGRNIYVPDFYLPKYGVWLEVKGIWQGNGKKKFRNALSLLGRDRLILLPTLYRPWFYREAMEARMAVCGRAVCDRVR